MALNRVELLLGWLAVILAGAVVAYTYFGGFIAPDSVQPDLIRAISGLAPQLESHLPQARRWEGVVGRVGCSGQRGQGR